MPLLAVLSRTGSFFFLMASKKGKEEIRSTAWQQEAAVRGGCRWTVFLTAALCGRHLWGSLIFVQVWRGVLPLRPKPMTFAHPRATPLTSNSWINGCSQTTLHQHLFASHIFALPHLAAHLNSRGEESPQSVSDSPPVAPAPMPKETRGSACAHVFAWPFVQSLAHVQEGCLAFCVRHYVWGDDNICSILNPWSKLPLFSFRLSSFSSIFPGALLGTAASPCCQRRKVGFGPGQVTTASHSHIKTKNHSYSLVSM